MPIKRRPLLGNGNSRNVPANSLAYSCGCSGLTQSILELRIPVGSPPLGRGVEHGPEHIEFRRATRILTGIGHRTAHLAGPEMADGTVAAGEHAVAGNVGIFSTDVVTRVVAGRVGKNLVPRPAARLLGFDQPRDRR